MTSPIDNYMPHTGRYIRESGALVNLADLLFQNSGLAYSTLLNKSGIFTREITIPAGEKAAINLFFDKKSVLSLVDITGAVEPIVRDSVSTGDYDGIITPIGLNLTETFVNDSQGQIVYDATGTGNVIADGAVANSIIVNADTPISVIGENTGATAVTVAFYVKFYEIAEESGLNLLRPATQLESNTEMGDYGVN